MPREHIIDSVTVRYKTVPLKEFESGMPTVSTPRCPFLFFVLILPVFVQWTYLANIVHIVSGPRVADWAGGVSACCTAGLIFGSRGQWMAA